MPNHFAFDVKIARTEIEKILSNKDVDYIVVSGTSTYLGQDKLEVKTNAKGFTADHESAEHPIVAGCIQPCP